MDKVRFRECKTKDKYFEMFLSEAGKPCNHPRTGPVNAYGESEKHERLLGDIISSALKKIGITPEVISNLVGGNCGCEERKEKLNKVHKWAKGKLDPYRLIGIFRKTESKIPCAVTTSARKNPTITRCVSSLQLSGFVPTVFAEPDSDTSSVGCDVVFRDQHLGCWGNWIQSLRDILDKDKESQEIAIFQDDCVLCLGVSDFLKKSLWPSKDTGAVSLYTCAYHSKRHKEKGFVRISGKYQLGALAYIFPRSVAEQISSTDDWRGHWKPDRTLDGQLKKSVDTFVGHKIAKMGLNMYYHIPSLAQHIGENSTIGNGSYMTSKRTSSTFVGEGFDAMTLLKETAYRRESL